MNPLDRLTTIISELMGREPSDPDVLKAVVDVVMAIRPDINSRSMGDSWARRYLDEGEG